MNRLFTLAVFAGLLFTITSLQPVAAVEPKATGTVDVSSSVPDVEKLQAFSGTGVILDQKEWERLAAAWGIKEVTKVDFTKELLLVGTWRGSNFKFLGDVKNGDLVVELVGDKEAAPGFRYKVLSINRTGITKFQGKELPAPAVSDLKPIEEKASVNLSGTIKEESLQNEMPVNGVITSQEQWDKLVKVWNIKDTPQVDFTRQWLVVGTSRGTSFDLNPVITNGDLVITTKGTTDLAPGFRWRVKAINREGIRTLQGKEFNPANNVPKNNTTPTNPQPTNPPSKNPTPTNPPRTNPPPTNPPPPANPAPTNPPPKNAPFVTLPYTNRPVTDLPVTNTPVTNTPVTNLPVTNLPVTNRPVTNLPVVNWPFTNLPVTNTKVTNLPVTNLPVTNLKVTNPKVTNLPVTNRPVTNLPVTNLPVTNSPPKP